MRGKPKRVPQITHSRGLIPACAGKTRDEKVCTRRTRAHPRVCGENIDRSRVPAVVTGSSPRVRGKLAWLVRQRRRSRLIPACAGKTSRLPTRRTNRRAHPRVCGENALSNLQGSFSTGSSPRVRGKHARIINLPDDWGLIPACAGKTVSEKSTESPTTAHPRVCGENEESERVKKRAAGSSPRVRGKLSIALDVMQWLRLIPACAGKTLNDLEF